MFSKTVAEQDARKEDNDLLDRMLSAYERIALEGIQEAVNNGADKHSFRDQILLASSRAFAIRQLKAIPHQRTERTLHVLRLSALACCGDRLEDLQLWYKDRAADLAALSDVGGSWDEQLMSQLLDGWVLIFRRGVCEERERVDEMVAALRDAQLQMEERVFDEAGQGSRDAQFLRLLALYNWSRATELVGLYMLREISVDPAEFLKLLSPHFDASIQAAAEASDIQLGEILRLLHASVAVMVTKPLTADHIHIDVKDTH